MSRGMPSLTALLGLLAIAGYQNKNKLAETLSGAGNHTGGQPQAGLGGLMGNLSGMVSGASLGGLLNGELGELVERFKQNGQGEAAQSWVNEGPNDDISPPQLKQAIGPDIRLCWSSRPAFRRTNWLRGFHENFRPPWTNTRRAAVCRIGMPKPF